MNKKLKYEILLIILVIIVIFNLAIILGDVVMGESNTYNVTTVGSNENGTVYKIIAGNPHSNETVGISACQRILFYTAFLSPLCRNPSSPSKKGHFLCPDGSKRPSGSLFKQ